MRGTRIAEADRIAFARVARSRTAAGDAVLPRLTALADHAKLWMLVAAGLAATGDRRLRRGAHRGLLAIGLTSFVANQVGKRAVPRPRPARDDVPLARIARRVPTSSSFPSGHSASAAAFALAASREAPVLALPLGALAAAVGYSRVYTGVHYPGDVAAGVVLGAGLGYAVSRALPEHHDDIPPTPAERVEPRPSGAGVVAVVNPEAGGGRGRELADLLERELPDARVRRLRDGEDLLEVLREVAPDAAVLAVAGGDGSVNAGATVAREHGLPLLVLSGGTFNHFAGDAGIGDPAAAIEAVRLGSVVRADVGEVVGDDGVVARIFVNTLSVGSYPRFVQLRERWEVRTGKPVAAALAVGAVLRTERPERLVIDGVERCVALLFVGAGAYEPATAVPRYRPRLDSGLLDVRLLDVGLRRSGLRLLGASVAGVLGRSRVFRAGRRAELRIQRDAAGQIATDGETVAAPAAFTVRVSRRSLMVYAPDR